jgi:allantoicase
MKSQLQKLNNQLQKIETELSKCRGSVLEDGWQTQRYAKKSRKWDIFAQEKMKILGLIEDLCLESRNNCPAGLICKCQSIPNWIGDCKMYKKEKL